MKKVTHLVRWFLPFTASFIRNQIMYHERYRPGVVYLQEKEGDFQREIAERHETASPFRRSIDRLVYERSRLLTPAAKKRVKAILREQSPDILHAHYGVDCLVYAEVIRELGIPACVSFYGYDCTSFPKRFGGYGKRLLQRKVFGNPGVRAVLAMTEDMKQDLLQLGCPEEKIIVHYYGTETQPFYQDLERPDTGEINVLIISGLQEKKGHAVLLDAFARAGERSGLPLHLHIVGDGPLRADIGERVRRLGLPNVTLHGPVVYGSETHLEHLRRSHIFAHPSITPVSGDKEGIPGAIIEAMAAGLPVVSTYHAGIPHVLTNEETGILVRERDVAGLAEALVRLARDGEERRRLAGAGQRYALDELDVRIKEKELETIYDALLDGRTRWKNGRRRFNQLKI